MSDLRGFLEQLDKAEELARVRVEVDPELELSEIAQRVVKQQGKALLFERVTGSSMPVAINLLGSARRIELALGRHPQQVGQELKRLIEAAMPPRPKKLLEEWRTVGRVLAMAPKRVSGAECQEVEERQPKLSRLPILKCWPKDAGRFVTCGMVITYDPDTDARNMGIYRMQVVGEDQLLMHWQIQKGGGFHYWKAEQQNKALAVAVVIGGDPIYYMTAVCPLPEGIDELAFAGFLRGKPVPLVYGKTKMTAVPADAEIVIEGMVPPDERLSEGPFGDHFGHYSHPKPCPVMWIQTVTRRAKPIYQAAVVGKPPQEDRYIGDAVQEMMLPLARIIHPELRDMWSYYEAGFHSLCVVSVWQRFGKEGMKTALGLLGTGQMALTKCVVLVDHDVDARNFNAVLRAIRDHFDPAHDFLLLPGVPFDTLDFTSLTLNVGSKMVLDATPPPARAAEGGYAPFGAGPAGQRAGGGATREGRVLATQPARVSHDTFSSLHLRVRDYHLVDDCLLAVKVQGEGRSVVEELVRHPALAEVNPHTKEVGVGVKLIAAVSEDVDLHDRESLLWGIFTRFDPARDVVFTEATLQGSWPIYRGRMGIDATFKPGYPEPAVMAPQIIERVTQRWHHYWTA